MLEKLFWWFVGLLAAFGIAFAVLEFAALLKFVLI